MARCDHGEELGVGLDSDAEAILRRDLWLLPRIYILRA